MTVDPPVIPTSQRTPGSTRGDEMTRPSSAIATRRRGSSGGWQAASAVSRSQVRWPADRKSTVTCQSVPNRGSGAASAPATAEPSRAAGPSRTGCPVSSGTVRSRRGSAGAPGATAAAAPAPRTGWMVSCAVRPITSTACRGVLQAGQVDDDPPLAGRG